MKRHPSESYHDVIEGLVTSAVDDDPLNDDAIRGPEKALEDIRHRRLPSTRVTGRKMMVLNEVPAGIHHRARKDLQKLDRNTEQRIIRALHGLTEPPYTQLKKLKGTPSGYPVYAFRTGLRFRAILSVHDRVLVIHVLEIEDRKQACRDF